MQINITAPDSPLTTDWLREQLGKLKAFKYIIDEEGPFEYIELLTEKCGEEQIHDNFGTNVVEIATDSIYDSKGETVEYARIMFEDGNTCYVDPKPNSGEISGRDRKTAWPSGTWMDGIVALARSVTSRHFALGSEGSQRVSELLHELAMIESQPAQVTITQ